MPAPKRNLEDEERDAVRECYRDLGNAIVLLQRRGLTGAAENVRHARNQLREHAGDVIR